MWNPFGKNNVIPRRYRIEAPYGSGDLKSEATPKEGLYSYLEGRMYEQWIDTVNGVTRNEGHAVDGLISIPSGIIESLLRDERFTERDLEITNYVGSGGGGGTFNYTFTCTSLRYAIDDYYLYSIIYNATTGKKYWCSDFTGSTKTLVGTTTVSDGSIATGDKIFLTNIKGDDKINFASFDVIGNTADGLRKDWIFGRSIYQETDMGSLLDSILYESRCILFTSYNQYKLVALDAQASVGTWTSPLKTNGREMFAANETHISQLFNDYRINYHFDYGSGEYKKTYFVNKSGFSSELTDGSDYKDTCKTLYDTYAGLQNKFEYNCDWIYDDDTAELFFDKIFAWYSKQRMLVGWAGGVKDYLQYEIGDQVILNNSRLLPTGINNVAKFMIYENPLLPLPGAPVINFRLIELT